MRFSPPLSETRCFIIAEAGSNHLGNRNEITGLIGAAAHSGADAVKFQLFRLEDILVNPIKGDRRTLLDPDLIPWIAEMCREYRIEFMCTPFAPWAVDVLDPYVRLWKVGSFEHAREDVLRAVEATGKPVIAACGRGVPQTDEPWHLLYCVSKYPAFASDIFLPEFYPHGPYDGFSDHTTSDVIPALAVAKGARIIEKHLRLYSTPTDSPDYPHALDPADFGSMVNKIRLAETVCLRPPPTSPALSHYPNRRE